MEGNFFWEDFISELIADLLMGQDVEELAKVIGKAPNTVMCFTYKSKAQNIPNLKQFAEMLEYVGRSNPGAVREVLRRLCARFGVVAGSRAEVLRQIADEFKVQGSRFKEEETEARAQFRFPRDAAG